MHVEFESRHFDIEDAAAAAFRKSANRISPRSARLSASRQLLIGALFSGEYALESAALFNPSIVPHPDQSGVPEGGLRFIMSLRATGEGHISSIEFRSGVISPGGCHRARARLALRHGAGSRANPSYRKKSFIIKLQEMGFDNEHRRRCHGSAGGPFHP